MEVTEDDLARFGGIGDSPSPTEEIRSDWFVQIDPPQYEYEIPPDVRIGIRIPGGQTARDDRRGSQQRWVVYPPMPSQVVAVGLNEQPRQTREVWNLASRRRLGKIEGIGLRSDAPISLSPDGKYFAGYSHADQAIGIWDIGQGKVLGTIPFASVWGTRFLSFAADNRLVFEEDGQLQVWSLPDLVLEHYLSIERWRNDAASSLSPGGRYLAMGVNAAWDGVVAFYDLTTGQHVGDLRLNQKGECQGTAFSQDGRYFAVMQDGFWGKGVSIFDVETGRLVAERRFNEDDQFKDIASQIRSNDRYQGPRLEWFPDGRYLLLYGRGVFDIRQETLVATLPAAVFYHVKPLPGQRVAVIHEQDIQLVPFELADQFESAGAVLAAGGTFLDASRPRLTPADRTSVARRTLSGEETVPWTARPEKLQSLPRLTTQPVRISGGYLYRAATAAGEDALAAVMYSDAPIEIRTNFFARQAAETRVRIETYNLRTGRAGSKFDLPFTTLLMCVTPDGSQILTRVADGLDRLDLWSSADGSHVLGFRPYQPRANEEGEAVDWAAFIDTQRLLTRGSGRLTLWQLPECRVVYEVEVGEVDPVLTPCGDYVLVSDPELWSVFCLNTTTGVVEGSLSFDDLDPGRVSALAVDATGTQVAAITRRMSGGELVVADLSTGSDVSRFPMPITADVLQWAGESWLLLDGVSLVNLSTETVCWDYSLPMGRHLLESPDGRHWLVTADRVSDREFTMLAVDIPQPAILQQIESAGLQRIQLLEPGGEIALQLNIPDPPGMLNFRQEVWNHLVEEFALANIRVVDQAPIALIISGGVRSTGETLTTDNIFNLGNQSPSFTIAGQEVRWEIRVAHGGQTVWETSLAASNAGGFTFNSEMSAAEIQQSAQQQLTDGMWNGARAHLLNFSPPKHAFPAGASYGIGTSRFTPRGIE